jgi:hypothetical protein
MYPRLASNSILLPQLPQCQDYNHELPPPGSLSFKSDKLLARFEGFKEIKPLK